MEATAVVEMRDDSGLTRVAGLKIEKIDEFRIYFGKIIESIN